MKPPSAKALRPDLPSKQLPNEPRPFKSRKESYRNLTPPQHEVSRAGPEAQYDKSIRAQLSLILANHEVTASPELITALMKWRRA